MQEGVNQRKSSWIPISKAASFLGVSRDTLRRWEKKGKIKAFRSPTNRRYYTEEQLRTTMSSRPAVKVSSPPALPSSPQLFLVFLISFLLTIFLAFVILSLIFRPA